MRNNHLYNPNFFLLNKKKKRFFLSDFYIKTVFVRFKPRCFWNFNQIKPYFFSFRRGSEKKDDAVSDFYQKYLGLFF
jgi:hypothetical protein